MPVPSSRPVPAPPSAVLDPSAARRTTPAGGAEPPLRGGSPARVIRWEIAIVLGLSLGRSAVYAVVQLLDRLTQGPLSGQSTVLNPAQSDRWAFDLAYQLLGIGFALVPVALVLHLTWIHGRNPFRAFGLDLRRPGQDLAWGLGLFLVIGVGTLGVYGAGRALGLTTAIVGSGLGEAWYSTPVLLLSATRHALVEEVIVGVWLVDRLAALQRLRGGTGRTADPAGPVPAVRPPAADGGEAVVTGRDVLVTPVRVWPVLLAAALLRGAYHLYQGVGPGLGNALMGVVFVLVLLRTRRAAPLVVAHVLLDAAGFVGYPLLARWGLLG